MPGKAVTLVKMLMAKLKRASKETGIRRIALAGGVSANSGLRQSVKTHGEKLGWEVFIPDFEYCTDNAAMIAAAAVFKYEKGIFCEQNVAPLARMPIGSGQMQ